jgi:tetratricopeptide (TPR) repeat protein
MMNVGILERDRGLLDQAIPTLAAAALLFPEHQRGPPLHSLGIALQAAGRYVEAAAQFADGRKGARGDQFWALLVSEAGARFNAGEREDAVDLLREFASVDNIPLSALVTYACIFAGIGDQEQQQDRRTAEALIERLQEASSNFIEMNNLLRAKQCIGAAARVASAFTLGIEGELWKQEAAIDAASNSIPDPVTVLELLRIAIVDGDATRASELLPMLPLSLAQFFGGLSVTSQSLEALSPLDAHFDRLTSVCMSQNLPASSVQIIADIRRNAHARAVQLRRSYGSSEPDARSTEYGRPEDCIVYIGEGLEPFLTLELVKTSYSAFFVFTSIENDRVNRSVLASPTYLAALNESIEDRLIGWHNGRRGEPFDVSSWPTFYEWLRAAVAKKLPRGGHVVVIEHVAHSSIPFHIALSPEWGCSTPPTGRWLWLVRETAPLIANCAELA